MLTNPFPQQYKQLQSELLAIVEPLTVEQWNWRPAPREWSIAQCVDHINTVNSLVVPRLEEAVRLAAEQGMRAPGPFRYPLFDRLFVFALEPGMPLKQQAPELYRPSASVSQEAAWQQFIQLQARLVSAAHQSHGLDLVRVKIASPVSSLMRFSLGTWLAAMINHEANHIQQAARVRQDPAFPPATVNENVLV
jgi:hypothetical protein